LERCTVGKGLSFQLTKKRQADGPDDGLAQTPKRVTDEATDSYTLREHT